MKYIRGLFDNDGTHQRADCEDPTSVSALRAPKGDTDEGRRERGGIETGNAVTRAAL